MFEPFLHNPFESKRFSRDRKVSFGYDNAVRLQALDPVRFADRIKATTTACQVLEKAMGRTGSAVGTGRGKTIGTDEALQTYRNVVGSKYNVVRDRLGKTSDVVVAVFGKSIQKYTRHLTKTNAANRMEELDLLLDTHAEAVGEDVVTAIADAVEAYTGKRTVQRTALAAVEAAQLAAQQAEQVLDQELWLNAGAVFTAYPSYSDEDKARRAAAANYSLLERMETGE